MTTRNPGAWDAPEWFSQGACRGTLDVDFFAEDEHAIARAKAVCAQCDVVRECLAFAVERGEIGVWGGTTRRERRGLRTTDRLRLLSPFSPRRA